MKSKWWLLVYVTLAAVTGAGIVVKSRDRYPFIAKHHGKQFPVRLMGSPVAKGAQGPTWFAFNASPSDVAASVKQFAKENGFTESPPGSNFYVDWSGPISKEEVVFFEEVSGPTLDWGMALTLPKSATCYVAVMKEPSWLDRQWAAVRKWFGR